MPRIFFLNGDEVHLKKRCDGLLKIADLIEKRSEEIASTITNEMGKPLSQAMGETLKCAALCRYYAEVGPELLKPRFKISGAKEVVVRYDPLGLIFGIMPWNFPLWQAFRFGVPAILSGNVAMLKPAPNVALCGQIIEDLFSEVFGEISPWITALIEVEDVGQVIDNDIIGGVALTGSYRAGSAVAQLAGKSVKKCVLELGGSDAFIVLADADIPKAAKWAVKSRMNNSGQTCISAKRIIVHHAVKEVFLTSLIVEYRKLNVGDPRDSNTHISALARKDLVDTLENQVNDALNNGARWIVEGGRDIENKGIYLPGLLTDVDRNMRAYHEELFGPVAMIFFVENDDAAIALANDSSFGLGGTIWTENKIKALELAARLEVGAVAINGMVRSDPQLPFGGVKKSGFGRELGEEGLKSFVNIKSIVVH